MSVYLLNEKVVLVDNKVATSEDCCCPTGACCVGAECSIVTENDCNGMGGTYQGDDSVCDPNPCGGGACCVDGECSITTEAECTGVYQGDGTSCDDVDCTKGACCIDGVCSQTTEEDCAGTFQGLGVPCTPNPCVACRECAFFNPDDGRYYHVRKRFSVADFLRTGVGYTLTAHSETVHVERCTDAGIDCSESFGFGTFDYEAEDYHCHCDDTYFCTGTPAFGFYGLNSLTFSYECTVNGDPDPGGCGSSFILSCDFGECLETAHFEYLEPCILT